MQTHNYKTKSTNHLKLTCVYKMKKRTQPFQKREMTKCKKQVHSHLCFLLVGSLFLFFLFSFCLSLIPSVGVKNLVRIIFQGTIFFPLPDGTGLLFNLVGTAEPPKPSGKVTRDVPCKTTYTEPLSVVNWLKKPQRSVIGQHPRCSLCGLLRQLSSLVLKPFLLCSSAQCSLLFIQHLEVMLLQS